MYFLQVSNGSVPNAELYKENDDIWVQYFKQKKDLWTLDDKIFITAITDVVKVLSPPEVVRQGYGRLLYKFKI